MSIDATLESRPLRVLHLLGSSEPGGVTRYVHDLSVALRDAGATVRLAGEHGDWHAMFERARLTWWRVPMQGGPVNLWRSAARLIEHLQHEPIDVIHCHHRRASLVGRRLQRRFGAPLLFTLHLSGIPIRGWWRWASDFGDIAHAPSRETRDWLMKAADLPETRIAMIPHGIDPARFPYADEAARLEARRALNIPDDATVAAYVGRLEEPKYPHWLLDVAQRGATSRANLHIVIQGDGPDAPALRDCIARDNLASRVTLLPAGDPTPTYAACDALLLPSGREGFPLVCVEAMSVGRPVLRTRRGGWQEQIVEGETGRSATIERAAFVEMALDALADRAALRRMGEAAAKHVRKHFTFAHQLDQTLALYRRMVAASRRGPA